MIVRESTREFISNLRLGQSEIFRKLVVTGGTGFIGAHLVHALAPFFDEVVVIDINNINDSLMSVLNEKYGTVDYSNVHYYRSNILDYDAIEPLFSDATVVVHAAAMLGVENVTKRPYDVMNVNLRGTYNVVEAIRKKAPDIKRMLLTSSSEVYGKPRELPLVEDMVVSPVSYYGVSKLASERLFLGLYAQYGYDARVVRYFNVYGEGQPECFVVPLFIRAVINNKQIKIFGNGLQSRCYTYITDGVDGTIRALLTPDIGGEIFNIGSDSLVSVRSVADFIIHYYNTMYVHNVSEGGFYTLPIKYVPYNTHSRYYSTEPIFRQPDIGKARCMLEFDPKVDWKEGISRVFDSEIKHNTFGEDYEKRQNE